MRCSSSIMPAAPPPLAVAAVAKVAAVAIVAAAVILFAGCGGSTSMRAEWWDKDYAGGPVDNVMTIAVFERPIYRRLLEDELTARLRERGVTIVSSAAALPGVEPLTREAIDEEVRQRGIDAVLVTRLVDVEKVRQVVEGSTVEVPHAYYNSLYSYYYTVNEERQTPGYTKEQRAVVLESNLYDMATERLIWSAVSETLDPQSGEKAIEAVATLIVQSLGSHGLL